MKEQKQIEKKLQELKPLLQDQFKVKELGYFGSLATNSLKAESDIDILVEFTEPIGWNFLSLKFLLEEQLNRPVDLVTKKALKKQLKHSILNQVKYL